MMTLFKVLILSCYVGIVTFYYQPVDGERILALSPIAGRSHWNFMRGILRALTDHGHQVTVFTSILDGNRENYTEIDLSKEIEPLVGLNMSDVNNILVGHIHLINFVHSYSRSTCESFYKNDVIKDSITARNSNYDVVLIEFMASECVSYLSAKLNLPLIYVTPPPLISYTEHLILGHYSNPAFVSHVLADYAIPRTFYERFTNTLLLVYTSCLLRYKSLFEINQQPFDLVKPIKPSIVFSNAHYITDSPRPLPPSVISVGGIHLSQPKRIPEDVLTFIENSTNGVIFFTLGSVVAISSLPKNVQESIFEVLGQVPYRVLLKYEDDIMIDIPKNVMTKKWFPQRDILLHPNIKLFISHGGISGVYETVDAGKPVLGFPLFFDQSRNLANLVDAGMAIMMNLESLSKDTFIKAIIELVSNEKYTKNAKLVSERFKDRPMSPAQSVDYWTRYVIRHKGAPHLKSHALNLTWYQYFLLDVIVVLLLLILLIFSVIYIILRIIYTFCILKVISRRKSKFE